MVSIPASKLMAERLAELSAEIRTMAGNGIEERHDEIQGQLESARTTEARFAHKAFALVIPPESKWLHK